MDKKKEAIEVLKEYEQNHIIKLLDKLDEQQQEELIEQINKTLNNLLKEPKKVLKSLRYILEY